MTWLGSVETIRGKCSHGGGHVEWHGLLWSRWVMEKGGRGMARVREVRCIQKTWLAMPEVMDAR